MAITEIWRGSRIRAAGGCAPPAGDCAPLAAGRRSRSHRAGRRLWVLLSAQALLDGTAGTPGGIVLLEDDYRRLAARRLG